MKKSEYVGPWPRKRHSHTCVTCKRKNNQGAVYCYKSKCKMPQSIENCTYCRPLTESPTYRPPQPQPQLRSVSDFAQWAEDLIARGVEDLESLDLSDGISIDTWGAALLNRGWLWSDEKARYEKGCWFVWFLAQPGQPVRAILNHAPAPIEVDVCIAGNSAVNGRCGDSACVCSPAPEGCEVCGCEPCSCDAPCEGCGRIVCECNAVKVAADRLGDGKGSDIRRSYSADTIGSAKSTIRAPFKHEGLLWCAVSLGMGLRAEAYRLTGAEHFADKRKKTTYNAKVLKDNGESARADRNGFYHGMTVKHKGESYVLTGPPIMFVAAAAPAEQPTTFHLEQPELEPIRPVVGVQLNLFGGAL